MKLTTPITLTLLIASLLSFLIGENLKEAVSLAMYAIPLSTILGWLLVKLCTAGYNYGEKRGKTPLMIETEQLVNRVDKTLGLAGCLMIIHLNIYYLYIQPTTQDLLALELKIIMLVGVLIIPAIPETSLLVVTRFMKKSKQLVGIREAETIGFAKVIIVDKDAVGEEGVRDFILECEARRIAVIVMTKKVVEGSIKACDFKWLDKLSSVVISECSVGDKIRIIKNVKGVKVLIDKSPRLGLADVNISADEEYSLCDTIEDISIGGRIKKRIEDLLVFRLMVNLITCVLVICISWLQSDINPYFIVGVLFAKSILELLFTLVDDDPAVNFPSLPLLQTIFTIAILCAVIVGDYESTLALVLSPLIYVLIKIKKKNRELKIFIVASLMFSIMMYLGISALGWLKVIAISSIIVLIV